MFHDKVPFTWAGHLCVILPYELRDQEIRIVLQNLQAGQDFEYDWEKLTTVRPEEQVKDLWSSFSNSIYRWCNQAETGPVVSLIQSNLSSPTTTPGHAHDKVINANALECYIVDNVFAVQPPEKVHVDYLTHTSQVIVSHQPIYIVLTKVLGTHKPNAPPPPSPYTLPPPHSFPIFRTRLDCFEMPYFNFEDIILSFELPIVCKNTPRCGTF